MPEIKTSIIEYSDQIKAGYSHLPGQNLHWLRKRRDEALERFEREGFPSPREEEWKYTNVTAIERKLFKQVMGSTAAVDQDWLQQYSLPRSHRLVFSDGQFAPLLSSQSEVPSGVILTNLKNALASHPELVEKYFGQCFKRESHGFLDFNTANFSDGCFIYIGENSKVEFPIELIFVNSQQGNLASLRNIVVVEPGAKVEIVESYISPEPGGYLNACVNEMYLADSAEVEWYKFQCDSTTAFHFGGNYSLLGDGSRFRHHNFSYGAVLVRNEVHCELGHASESELNGLYLAGKQQHCDNHTRIHHNEPDGVSRENYKGILDDRARGVFQGRIIVEEGAQKTDSEMNNRNLLLSEQAEVDTKPQLEIYADDVKCAHGVTVGQLDDEAVFYLQSRSIDENEARNILTFAFANEMVQKINNPEIKTLAHKLLLTQFPQTGIRKEWL